MKKQIMNVSLEDVNKILNELSMALYQIEPLMRAADTSDEYFNDKYNQVKLELHLNTILEKSKKLQDTISQSTL